MTKYLFQCVRCRLLCSLECDNCGGLNFEKTEDKFICKNCKENLISAIHFCGIGATSYEWLFGKWDWNTEKIPVYNYYPKNKDNFFKEEEWVKKEEEESKKKEEESKKKFWYGFPWHIIFVVMLFIFFDPASWVRDLFEKIF